MERLSFRVGFQHRQKGALGDGDVADHLHPLLALLLLFQEFPLPGDVAAVALGDHVLPEGGDGGPGDDLAADRPLDRDLEHLAGDLFLQPLAGLETPGAGAFTVDDLGEGIDLFAVDQDVQQGEVAFPVVDEVVVEGAVALGDGLEAVVKVEDHLGQRHLVDQLRPAGVRIVQCRVHPPLLHAELHDGAQIPLREHHGRPDVRLFGFDDRHGFGVVGRVVHDRASSRPSG